MFAMKTKKMTIKYWNALDVSSRVRALTHVFPTNQVMVSKLSTERPDKGNCLWKIVFDEVRIPVNENHYKTYVKGWYLC